MKHLFESLISLVIIILQSILGDWILSHIFLIMSLLPISDIERCMTWVFEWPVVLLVTPKREILSFMPVSFLIVKIASVIKCH